MSICVLSIVFAICCRQGRLKRDRPEHTNGAVPLVTDCLPRLADRVFFPAKPSIKSRNLCKVDLILGVVAPCHRPVAVRMPGRGAATVCSLYVDKSRRTETRLTRWLLDHSNEAALAPDN
jgi:hypothetical protein